MGPQLRLAALGRQKSYVDAQFIGEQFVVANTVVRNEETGETTIKSKYGEFVLQDGVMSSIPVNNRN